MPDFLRSLVEAARQWPLYTALVLLVLGAFLSSGLAGYRLLGDDNETDANELVGPPQAGGHGGAARFYHK